MREYGQIQCSYWERASEERWSSDATLLGAYLLTGPNSNGIGCYRLTFETVSGDLRWAVERVSSVFEELSRNGFCNRFGTVVLMPQFLRFNPIANGNVAKARAGEFERIPNDEAKLAAALALLEFGGHWEKGFVNRLETLSKGYGKQHPTQNQNQPYPTQGIGDANASPPSPASPAPPPPRRRTKEEQAARLAEITDDALDAYNRILAKPNGRLRRATRVGIERKRMLVHRAIPTLRDICQDQYDSPVITRELWDTLFEAVKKDPFKSGKQRGGAGHENWKPTFAYLVRPDVILDVFEAALEQEGA